MDIKIMLDFVAPSVRNAVLEAAKQLERLGIRYAIAGGLAVGTYGYIRNTTDVRFLVGDEAFEHHGSLVTFKTGVPIQVGGIRIDYLSTTSLGSHLEDVLDQPPRNEGFAVVPLEALVYMKLVARRRKDQVDVIELIKLGANVQAIQLYLEQHGSDLLPFFNLLLQEAEQES